MMLARTWLATVLATICALSSAMALAGPQANPDGLRALDGEWIFIEDRTEGRTLEQLSAPMASKFSMRVEDGAVILNGHGSGHKDVRVALDGSVTERPDSDKVARYRGAWKQEGTAGGTFEYEVAFERPDGAIGSGIQLIRRSFRHTDEGLLVTVAVNPPDGSVSIGLYRHAEDIPMPPMAKATAADLAWLAGDWVGTRSSGSSIEERWSPPLGGAMLAVARTVNTSGKMVAFEYLRIVEREDGLVYVAQPAGKTATEFVLTELTSTRAVFDNPRHDYPKRIVYELSADGVLSTATGYLKGGTPRRLDYRREAD
ncbi:MAG: DUF6265 family protein [Phycisphaerales bacterium]